MVIAYADGVQTTRLYVDGVRVDSDVSTESLVATLRDRATDDDTYAWIDLCNTSPAEVTRLAEQLDLHALAVESALAPSRRPRLSRFETHLLLNVSHARLGDDGAVELATLTAFVTRNLVVTVRDETFPIDRVTAHLDDNEDLATMGRAYLLWGLLDVVVDDHINALEALDDVAEQLADELFEPAHDNVSLQQRAFGMRRSIAALRHVTLPLREVVTTLVYRDGVQVPARMQPYFADVYDHALHSADWTDSLRDQVASILETNVALQGNRMNAIMKQVTSWAAIIAVPTAITGFFGQNLQFPGFGTVWGFVVSCLIILGCGGLLWWLFRRNDWL